MLLYITCFFCKIHLVICAAECPEGYYGNNCDKCKKCFHGVCNRNNGTCSVSRLCKIGYEPPHCKERCTMQKFGINCLEDCGKCANSSEKCNETNGHCSKCAPGYALPTCTIKCNNTFGLYCEKNCHCKHANSCHPTTGVCRGGLCSGEWMSKLTHQPTCQIPVCLKTGYWGERCTNVCYCRHRTKCTKATGFCYAGCKTGYTGRYCTDRMMNKVEKFGLVQKTAVTLVAGNIIVLAIFLFLWRRRCRGVKKEDSAVSVKLDNKDSGIGKEPDQASIDATKSLKKESSLYFQRRKHSSNQSVDKYSDKDTSVLKSISSGTYSSRKNKKAHSPIENYDKGTNSRKSRVSGGRRKLKRHTSSIIMEEDGSH